MNFNTFTNYFFYLFVIYQYLNYYYPESTEKYMIIFTYNCIYLYSKLEILLKKNMTESHNFLIKHDKYQKLLVTLCKIEQQYFDVKNNILFHISTFVNPVYHYNSNLNSQESYNKITIDFISNNENIVSFEKDELINEFLPCLLSKNDDGCDEGTEKRKQDEFNYDFIIINSTENLKKIITKSDLINDESIFQIDPYLYKPLLCELLNGDEVIKIDFSNNGKFYNFLVVGNQFDKTFLKYFMKTYYEIDVKDDYVFKILDNNVNTILFEKTDIIKINRDTISK
jgi:hypothetical protein